MDTSVTVRANTSNLFSRSEMPASLAGQGGRLRLRLLLLRAARDNADAGDEEEHREDVGEDHPDDLGHAQEHVHVLHIRGLSDARSGPPVGEALKEDLGRGGEVRDPAAGYPQG